MDTTQLDKLDQLIKDALKSVERAMSRIEEGHGAFPVRTMSDVRVNLEHANFIVEAAVARSVAFRKVCGIDNK
jgi:hypothetical protein